MTQPPGPTGDTALGGPLREFPSTCWSRLAGGYEGEDGRAALESLAGRYWKPIYAYIRSSRARSNEDAKDLTQDFFLWIVESGFLGRADPGRGRFRGFVKAALNQYLALKARDAGRLKRGGGTIIVSMDAAPVDLPGPAPASPEEALDRAWKRELLVRAGELLREDLRRVGKEPAYQSFHDYYLVENDRPEYRQIADRYGITENDVLSHLRFAKQRYRLLLKSLVLETVDGAETLSEEWNALFGDRGGDE